MHKREKRSCHEGEEGLKVERKGHASGREATGADGHSARPGTSHMLKRGFFNQGRSSGCSKLRGGRGGGCCAGREEGREQGVTGRTKRGRGQRAGSV